MDAAARHYNVDQYYREIHYRARAVFPGAGPQVGTVAPGFRLPTVDGAVADLDELCAAGLAVVLFGCYTAPPAVREAVLVDQLSRTWPEHVSVLFVYTREIHPHEPLPPYSVDLGRHESMAEKIGAARAFRDDLGLALTVCVDDLSGSVHSAYGGLPSSAVVLAEGRRVVHRAEWTSAPQLESVVGNRLQFASGGTAATGVCDGAVKESFSETLWVLSSAFTG